MFAKTLVEQQLRQFILTNFLYGAECCIADDDSLAHEGIVDSTGVLQLVIFLEDNYGISVEDEELIPENLDSIRSIIAYVDRKTSAITASPNERPRLGNL